MKLSSSLPNARRPRSTHGMLAGPAGKNGITAPTHGGLGSLYIKTHDGMRCPVGYVFDPSTRKCAKGYILAAHALDVGDEIGL